MFDDLNWIIKTLFISYKKRNPLLQGYQFFLLDLRVQFRRGVFANILFSLFIPGWASFTFDIFYPEQAYLWKTDYFYIFLGLSICIYGIAWFLAPRMRRAKYVFLLRSLPGLQSGLFFIYFGLMLGLLVIPTDYLIWFMVFMLPPLTYIPIIYQRKLSFIESQLEETNARKSLLQNEPIWNHQNFLPDERNYQGYSQRSCLYSIIISLILQFLLFADQIVTPGIANLLRFGILNAAILYFIIDHLIHTIVIYKSITTLETDIGRKIKLKHIFLLETSPSVNRLKLLFDKIKPFEEIKKEHSRTSGPSSSRQYIFRNFFSILAPLFIATIVSESIPYSVWVDGVCLSVIISIILYITLHIIFMKIQGIVFRLFQQWYNLDDKGRLVIRIIYNIIGTIGLFYLYQFFL